jgi:exodeoxyribonuclease III
MLRIVSLNLNGIRSAHKKGLEPWLQAHAPDVLCVQELKAQQADLDESLSTLAGAAGHFHFAEKKGYSGVGLYSRKSPQAVRSGFGCDEFDAEGRYVEADFGKLTVISVYVPSGSASPERQEAKFRFIERFDAHLLALKASGREIVLCGDWNIAHQAVDLKNWNPIRRTRGFCPRSGPGSRASSMSMASSTCFAGSISDPISTPGGARGAKHGPIMSDGGSIIRSPRRASRKPHARWRFTPRRASATMRR